MKSDRKAVFSDLQSLSTASQYMLHYKCLKLSRPGVSVQCLDKMVTQQSVVARIVAACMRSDILQPL